MCLLYAYIPAVAFVFQNPAGCEKTLAAVLPNRPSHGHKGCEQMLAGYLVTPGI